MKCDELSKQVGSGCSFACTVCGSTLPFTISILIFHSGNLYQPASGLARFVFLGSNEKPGE